MKPPTDAIVSEARAHLSETLSHQTKLPDYGSRWKPQVDAMGRHIPSLTDSDACLRYAQYNITFDGRPPFPGDTGILQMREWAVANEFPQHADALLLMSENPMSGAESLGEFNGRLVFLVMYYHARNGSPRLPMQTSRGASWKLAAATARSPACGSKIQ